MSESELEERLKRIEKLTLLAAKNVYNVEELAFLLGKATKTIYNNLDYIPHYRNGKSVWFKKSEIEEWQCQVKCEPLKI